MAAWRWQTREREKERRLRELALRKEHIADSRGKALDEILEEMASLDRLRRLVANLRGEEMSASTGRVAECLSSRAACFANFILFCEGPALVEASLEL